MGKISDTKNHETGFNKPSPDELLGLLKRHGINDQHIHSMLLALALDPDKENIEDFWEAVIPRIAFNKLFTSSFSKPGSEVDGEIKVGLSELGQPVGFNIGERHILIVGRTGSGKSTLLMLMFAQLLLISEGS